MSAARRLPSVAVVLMLLLILAACGQTGVQAPNEPNEPSVPGVPARLEWSSADIGSVGVSGEVDVSGDASVLIVRASGSDIWAESDSFHYAYMPITGDVEIRARIDALEYTHDRAKAGVMIRAGLEPGAMHAMAGVTPGGQAQLVFRSAPDAASDYQAVARDGYPAWVKLTRLGTRFTASYSADGTDWTEIGSVDVPMGTTAYVGIAVTSRDQTRLGVAEVRGVQVVDRDGGQVGPTPPGATPLPVVADPSQWVCGTEPLSPRFTPTLYVATNGSDSNDGRDPSRPLRTLQRAANMVGPGDVVWVRGGVYSSDVSFTRSGTVDRPIVFESHPGECAILDGSDETDRARRVRFEGARFNVFRNFVVRNSPGQGVYLNDAHDNLITNFESYDNALSGVQNVGGNRNRFAYFFVHGNYDAPGGGNADGIGISSGSYNRIDHCVAYRNSDDGVDTWKSVNTVVERCISFENGFQGGDGNGFKAGGDSMTVNTVMRYNVAFGNKMQGFNYNSGRNVTFEHNTSFDNGYYGFIAANATLRNNLAFGDARRAWQDDGGNNQQRNSWNLGMGDPRFASTDPRSPNFLALASGSPAVGSGLELSGGAPDLGAVPYGETIASFLGIDLASLLND